MSRARSVTRGHDPRDVQMPDHLAMEFPDVARGWYYVASLSALRRPMSVQLHDREFVAFVVDGAATVLDGRCPHFGAKLARGEVVDGCLRCPLHGWRFRPDGRCEGTPSGESPPGRARVASYPTATIGGYVFFHADSRHTGDFPCFADAPFERMVPSPSFAIDVEMPWWMVSANGFDAQHFLAAHDRRLVGRPTVLQDDTGFEARAEFEVVGRSWRDRVTRAVSGPRVELRVRNAGGALVLVTSRFRRTVTYGLVSVHPRTSSRARVHTIIWVKKRHGLGQAFAWIDARIRASFIRAFLEPDVVVGEGVRYDRSRAINADALLTQYLDWLSAAELGTDEA